jgi:serine/threonine protein phosphatase PrpC
MVRVFKKSFNQVSNELKETNLDHVHSGTTANLILIKGIKLWCANCGDSRSILI